MKFSTLSFLQIRTRATAPAFRAMALLLAVLLSPVAATAHKVSSVSLITRLDTRERTYLLDAAMEVVPSEEREQNEQISPEQAAREFAEEYLTILFDEEEADPELSISIVSASDEDTPPELRREQLVVKLSGAMPTGAEEFLLYLDPSCPMAVVMVVVKNDRPERRMQVILAGEYSRPVNVLPVVEGDPFEQGESGNPAGEAADGDPSEGAGSEPAAGSGESDSGGGEKRDSSFATGFETFFAESLAPAFFVICLFLLTPRRVPVFLCIAALLIGQSLAVSLRGWDLVPPLSWMPGACGILLSVLAIESLVHRSLRWWRVALFVLAGFGAGILLSDSGAFRGLLASTAEAEWLSRLIGFVLGSEIAAVATGLVAGLCFLLLARFEWYRVSVIQPVAVLLAAYGLYLAVTGFG